LPAGVHIPVNPVSTNPASGNKKYNSAWIDRPVKTGISVQKNLAGTNKTIGNRLTKQAETKSNDPALENVTKAQPAPELSKSNSSQVNGEGNNSTLNIATVADAALNPVSAEKTDSPAVTEEPLNKKQPAKNKNSKFSLNFSFGPDISSVGFDKPGKIKPQFGIGIGYSVSERLSIRTGFYAGRKIYSADSADYHINPWGPYSFKLYEVKGNCFVYEIPVSLMYNFKQSKNHTWFVSTGLSSYLMKTEAYKYIYKNRTGQMLYHGYNFKNENSHFFSVLNVSGGYQYHVSNRFSILAEPYIKIPLSGVGVGKVRLNSAGVLFTASVKPFKK
jgi:hypothetical protein